MRLVLVGGGGFGRELLTFTIDIARGGGGPTITGYIDDGGPDTLGALGYDVAWLGTIADFHPQPGDRLVLGLGSPTGKKAVVDRLRKRGARFERVIHPTALITQRTAIGEGCIFAPFTGSGTDTRIGDFVTVNSYSGLGHDARVGDFTTLSAHVDVMGYVDVGAEVFIGSNASIMPNVTIGAGSKIGAGSIVYRKVPSGATIYATPAKRLKG